MVFRVRTSWLLLQASLNGLLLAVPAVVVGAIVGGVPLAVALGVVVFGVAAALAVPSIRRRHLVADSYAVVAVRTGFQLRAGWEDIVGFERTRFARVIPVVMLRLNDRAIITGLGGEPLDSRMLERVRNAGADRGIHLSPYVRRMHEGAFADLLRQRRPDLANDL